MIKLTINHQLSHLPIAKAKGTPQERLQKAIHFNDEFFKNIKSAYSYGDISPEIFAQILKRSANTNIPVTISSGRNLSGRTSIDLDTEGVHCGYDIVLPLTTLNNKVSKSYSAIFMHEAMHYFDRIINPKYNIRDLNVFNRGYNGRELKEFYNKYLYIKMPLNKSAVDAFLKDKPVQEQIDMLQNIRYNLKLELNAYKHTRKYLALMKKCFPKTEYIPDKPISYKEYHFPEKIKYLEEKLAEIIQAERARLAKK